MKNAFPMNSVTSQAGSASGHDRSYQRLGPDDVHDPCHIVGEYAPRRVRFLFSAGDPLWDVSELNYIGRSGVTGRI